MPTANATQSDVAPAMYAAVCRWLYHEAALLDHNRFDEWLALLAPDVRYVMPVRESLAIDAGEGIATGFAHFDENHETLAMRVRRNSLESAWAENPRSRTRRFVSNVCVASADDGELEVTSYLLVLRSRGASPDFEFIPCERRDRLRARDELFELVEREIVIDQATLGQVNLALFF